MPSVTVSGAFGTSTNGKVLVNFTSNQLASAAYNQLMDRSALGYGGGTVPGFLVTDGSTATIPAGTLITGVGMNDTVVGGPPPSTPTTLTDGSTAANQLILLDAGANANLTVSMGSGMIFASGNDTVSVSADGWLVGADAGVQVTATGADTLFASGAATLNANGNDTVFGGNGATVNAGGGALIYIGGTSAGTVDGGSGTMTVFGASNQTFNIGAGNDTIVGANNSLGDTVNATGVGLTTYFGGDNSSVTFTGNNSGNLFIGESSAGSGETINAAGASGQNAFFAGAGNDSIVGGKGGGNALFAGAGNDTLTGGGAGNNLFGFVAESTSNHVTVTDWNNTDVLYLGTGVSVMNQTVSNGSLSMTLSDNTTITFTGVSADIGSGNILT